MALKNFDDLREIDLSEHLEQRDGMDYLNWAKVVELLHDNGAEEVWFRPVINPTTNSSLFMTDREFVDKNGVVNKCYEVEVLIHIDDDEFTFRHPVTNGSNPVKDNSMTQSRVWAAQTRAFVKGVAIHKGLGFDLWLKDEKTEQKQVNEIDVVALQDPKEYFKKLGQLVATKMQKFSLTMEEVSNRCGVESNLEAVIRQKCNELAKIEESLEAIQ